MNKKKNIFCFLTLRGKNWRFASSESTGMVNLPENNHHEYFPLFFCDAYSAPNIEANTKRTQRIQLERQQIKYFPSLREYALYYGIHKKLLDSLKKDIIIMHPGPINRGVEITSDAADSHHSIILDQVENGVAIRMAVLYLLAGATS